jgi:hypothetical protein
LNDSSNPIISIDLSDGSTFRFDSLEDASAWLDKEQAAFGWLTEGGTQAGAGGRIKPSTTIRQINECPQREIEPVEARTG